MSKFLSYHNQGKYLLAMENDSAQIGNEKAMTISADLPVAKIVCLTQFISSYLYIPQ